MQRRVFLKWSFGTLTTTTSSQWVWAGSVPTTQGVINKNALGISRQQWQALIAIQSHLFPAETNSPGAQDVNAATYLYHVLIDPKFDVADRAFVKTGIEAIQRLANKQGAGGFVKLKPAQREKVLRQYEKSAQGSSWLNMILEYILEALLTDPVYGGNPKGIGWKWLGHTPGFPRPPKNKRYFLL